MFDLNRDKKRAAAQAQAQRIEQSNEAEKKKQKELEEVGSAFEMPLLLKAAELAGWKPSNPQDSNRKKAEAASVFLLSLSTEGRHKSTVEFITQLLAMNAMNSHAPEPEKNKRPSPFFMRSAMR
ncbi:TPA: hypothetical protein QDB51_002662 [Burkholderia vietnamiensis]|uniref:hypothetical protein n=1 Tax=Burkholderia multivorans TaxID=87883 RepID=UPI0011B236EF|nr:hypothetical protein [Burkholderia multivorans]HDR9188587.1 hypothetical protein [Burkholderia vietnamiensis]